jgi:hypothetical protein
MRYGNEHVTVAMDCYFTVFGVKQRLFEEEHAVVARETRHEMLRALKNKIPS